MTETENKRASEHIDQQGRLNVPMTCFFDKPPKRDGWRVIWSDTKDDAKTPRVYIYKKVTEE